MTLTIRLKAENLEELFKLMRELRESHLKQDFGDMIQACSDEKYKTYMRYNQKDD